jgi:fumarate hydratase class I
LRPPAAKRRSGANAKKGQGLEQSLLELIRRTSVDLPADVEAALQQARSAEPRGSYSRGALETMLENTRLARKTGAPLCQDTGTLQFFVQAPAGWDTNAFTGAACSAVSQATRLGYLRQNTLDAVTGSAYPLNLANGSPCFYIQQGARDTIDVRLVMKGGGSENVGCQYSLPAGELGVERDLEGVRRCILDAVQRAQGDGCAPGVLGVCIGGDRCSGCYHAKEQFLRKLDDRSPVAALAELEARTLAEANELGIGPMGLGGRTTLFGVKIGALSRLPASYFVTIAYMCWAFRRRGALLEASGGIRRWLY